RVTRKRCRTRPQRSTTRGSTHHPPGAVMRGTARPSPRLVGRGTRSVPARSRCPFDGVADPAEGERVKTPRTVAVFSGAAMSADDRGGSEIKDDDKIASEYRVVL